MFYIPPALVLGCNNPVSLNPLKDWIEEQTGFEPDFQQCGWGENSIKDYVYKSNNGYYDYNQTIIANDGYDNGNGDGNGNGRGFGYINGCGFYNNGYGNDFGDDEGNGYGCGDISD